MEATPLRRPSAAPGQEGVGPPLSLPSPRPHLARIFLALVDHAVLCSVLLCQLCCCYCASFYLFSLKILARLMTAKFLHTEIREKGGAYGGGARLSYGGMFTLYSYRWV